MRNVLGFALLTAICMTSCQADDIQDLYKQCKDLKETVCVGKPPDCWSGSNSNCEILATIQQKSDKFNFKLVGNSKANTYTALGIAESGKEMKDAAIVACTNDNANISMTVYWSYGQSPPNKIIPAPGYFTPGTDQTISDKMICSFELNSKFDQNSYKFDLASKNYAILLASGTYDTEKGDLQKHDSSLLLGPLSLTKPMMPTETTDKTPGSKTSSASHQPLFILPILTALSLLVLKFSLI